MSDPHAPQDPYAAGREPEPPSSSESTPPPPPPYGGQPPVPGEQPPAYGAPPPPPGYGAPQQPAYGAPQPPPYGGQPPAYGAPQPPAYGAQPPAYGAPPPPPAPAAYGYGAQPPGYAYPKNSLGVWALVLGLVAILLGCGFFAGIPAIILGSKAKRAAAEGLANNAGMGTAGIVLGWIATIGYLLLLVVFIIAIASGNWSNFHEFGNMNY